MPVAVPYKSATQVELNICATARPIIYDLFCLMFYPLKKFFKPVEIYGNDEC